MPQGWRTAKVFISSTFRDMQAERDHLVRVVFPALRERLYAHRVYLDEIDLRWGITREQSENDETLALCMKSIDECRPFFLAILGQRYGALLQDPRKRQARGGGRNPIPPSVTEREIMHAAFNAEHPCRAVFFLRDPAVIEQIPQGPARTIYAESDFRVRERLDALKQRIVASDFPVTTYTARWDPTATDPTNRVAGRLVGLEAFGAAVETALLSAIEQELDLAKSVAAGPADPLAREREFHERFAETRVRIFAGRDGPLEALHAYATSDATHACVVTGPPGSGKTALLARLALELRQRYPAAFVITHFAAASETSADLDGLLMRLAQELMQEVFEPLRRASTETVEAQYAREQRKLAEIVATPGNPYDPVDLKNRLAIDYELQRDSIERTLVVPAEMRELKSRLAEFFAHIPSDHRVIVLIDGLDQIKDQSGVQRLDWLPRSFPGHVKFVVSCIDDETRGSTVLRALMVRHHLPVVVPSLSDSERVAIIRQVPSLSAKSLDRRQIGLLLKNPGASNPLFLRVVLEELRAFGSFEQLTRRIHSMPGGRQTLGLWILRTLRLAKQPRTIELVQALFDQVIIGLEQEFDSETVRKTLTMLLVARRGLLERELFGLVAPCRGRDHLFAILRQLRPYLQNREGLLSFYHRELELAVRRRYLKAPKTTEFIVPRGSDEVRAHQELVEFFSAEPWQLDGTHLDQPIKIWNRRKCDELPWHVIKGGLGADALLLDPEFLEAKANCGLISDLADDFRRNFEKAREYEFRISRRLRKGTGGGLWSGRYEEPASVPMRRLRYIEEALRREASFLQRHPESLFAVLWNMLHWRDQPGLNQHCERQFHPSDRPPNLGLATWLEAWRDRRLQSEATNTWLQAVRPLPRPIGTADRTLFHGAPVTHLAAVPLRRAFVSAGDNVLRIWNADTGAELASLVIAGARSARDPFLRDVFALTVGDAWNWDEVARRGEQENPDLIRQPAEGDGRSVFDSPLPHISCIAAATEAKQVAVGFGKDVCVIDAASGETVHRFGCEMDVTSIAFSGDASFLAACDGSPTVLLWDLKTGKLAKRLVGKHDYYRVGFVPRFQVLYAVCQWWENDRPPTDFWNLVTGDLSTSLAAPFASFSLDGARMLYAYPGLEVDGGGSNARVGNWQKDGALSEPISHPTNIQLKRGPIALSADGSMIAAASDDDSTLDLIEVVSGGVLPRRPGHRIRALTFIDTADKDTYDDMLINRMDDYVEDRLQQSVHKLQPEWVGEPMVVSASDDGSICLTATTRFRPEPRWPVQHEDSIDHVEFTRDGRWLISVSWGSVRTWHADTGIPHLRLEPGGHLATCTPDSKAVAVEWREKAVKVLSLEDGALLHTIETGPILCLTHSADGKLMLAGDEQGRVRGWRPSTFEEVGTIASVEKPVHGLSLSPDNTMLGICSDDQEVRLYEVATGKLVRQFSARPPSESSSIAFNASALAFSRFDGQDIVVVLDQMVGELNYWQLDGTYLGCNQGLGDIRACSEGYPWLVLYNRNAGELSVRRARNSDRVAYWPSPRISRIATHPNGHVFAAAEGCNLLILRLEQPPADA